VATEACPRQAAAYAGSVRDAVSVESAGVSALRRLKMLENVKQLGSGGRGEVGHLMGQSELHAFLVTPKDVKGEIAWTPEPQRSKAETAQAIEAEVKSLARRKKAAPDYIPGNTSNEH
jgi:hypothetical protein